MTCAGAEVCGAEGRYQAERTEVSELRRSDVKSCTLSYRRGWQMRFTLRTKRDRSFPAVSAILNVSKSWRLSGNLKSKVVQCGMCYCFAFWYLYCFENKYPHLIHSLSTKKIGNFNEKSLDFSAVCWLICFGFCFLHKRKFCWFPILQLWWFFNLL